MTSNWCKESNEELRTILDIFNIDSSRCRIVEKILDKMFASGKILIEAPTGWGKTTVAVISTLLYNLAKEEEPRTVIYTSKTHNVLIKVFNLYKEILRASPGKLRDIKPILYLGKEVTCPYAITSESDDDYIYGLCEFLRYNSMCNYYINFQTSFGEANRYIIENWRHIDNILGKDSQLDFDKCLYYTIKNSLPDFNIIITSYYNLFIDPSQYSRDKYNYKSPIIIIDEIHNLPRYFFEHTISKVHINDLKMIENVSTTFNKIVSSPKLGRIKLPDIIDIETLYSLKLELDDKIRNYFRTTRNRNLLSTLYRVRLFTLSALMKYESVDLYYDKTNHIIYLLPRSRLSRLPKILNQFYAVIGLSATLSPIETYKNVLFGDEEDVELISIVEYPKELPKPRIFIDYEYTSRYRDRTISMIERVAKKIFEIAANKGNTLVYAASYELTKYIYQELKRYIISDSSTSIEVFLDERGKRGALSTLLELIKVHGTKKIIFLSSQRGSLSEGIDLPSIFNNIIIYGLSLPPFNLEDYLYTKYMLKKPIYRGKALESQIQSTVLSLIQSIGRVLRKGNPYVNIYIFDWRFRWRIFRRYFPKWFDNLLNNMTK